MHIDGQALAPRTDLAQEQIVELFSAMARHADGKASVEVTRIDRVTRQH